MSYFLQIFIFKKRPTQKILFSWVVRGGAAFPRRRQTKTLNGSSFRKLFGTSGSRAMGLSTLCIEREISHADVSGGGCTPTVYTPFIQQASVRVWRCGFHWRPPRLLIHRRQTVTTRTWWWCGVGGGRSTVRRVGSLGGPSSDTTSSLQLPGILVDTRPNCSDMVGERD